MKPFTALLLLISLLFRCSHPYKGYKLPEQSDIYDIITTIVKTDSLLKDTLHADLRKIDIISGPTEGLVAPLSIHVGTLLHAKVNNQTFFNASDSLYILFQNNSLQSFFLNRTSIGGIPVYRYNGEYTDESSSILISIPIFSYNNRRAYVEVISDCPGNHCAGCDSYYLEKKNGIWIIAEQNRMWIS